MQAVQKALGKMKEKRLLSHLLFALLGLMILIRLLVLLTEIRGGNNDFTQIPAERLTLDGYYSEDGRTLTRERADASISVRDLNQPVSSIVVYLGEAAQRWVTVRLHYTDADTSTEWVVENQMPEGDQSVDFSIPRRVVGGLCVEIGGAVGDVFSLDGIFVREQRQVREAIYELYLWLIAGLCLVALWAGLVCWRRKVSLPTIYMVMALLFGIAMMFAITPFSQPDDRYHYISSYYMASSILGEETVPLEHYSLDKFIGHTNSANGYQRVLNELFRTQPDMGETAVALPVGGSLYYPPQYLPSALGVLLAKVLGCSFLNVYFLGRFASLLFSVSCVYLALRRLNICEYCFSCWEYRPCFCIRQHPFPMMPLSMAFLCCCWHICSAPSTRKAHCRCMIGWSSWW